MEVFDYEFSHTLTVRNKIRIKGQMWTQDTSLVG